MNVGDGRDNNERTKKRVSPASSDQPGFSLDPNQNGTLSRPLDPLDQEIARHLEQDARMSLLEVSRRVGVSRPTVSEHLTRLIEQGTILGFHAKLNYHQLGYPITAFVGLFTQQASAEVEMIEGLRRIPEIEEIHAVAGRIDLLLKVRAHSAEHLRQVLTYKIQELNGVIRSETMIVLSSHLEWGAVGTSRTAMDAAEDAT